MILDIYYSTLNYKEAIKLGSCIIVFELQLLRILDASKITN